MGVQKQNLGSCDSITSGPLDQGPSAKNKRKRAHLIKIITRVVACVSLDGVEVFIV